MCSGVRCVCRCQIYNGFLLNFTVQDASKLILATLGSLSTLLFSAGLETFFHRFGRCPNHDDFLEQLISQSAPKLVLVTLAPLGPPWGISFSPWGYIQFSFAVELFRIPRSGIPDWRFHCGYIQNSAFWHPRLAFTLRIYNEFCVLALQIRVFNAD